MIARVVSTTAWLALVACPLVAQQRPEPPVFEKSVLPLLESRCTKCHAGSAPQAALDVRSRAALLKGGTSGPAIVIGAAEKSLLYQRASSGQMPLGGPRLTEEELNIIRSWIAGGAPAENNTISATVPGASARDRSHWAFQVPKRPPVPAVKNTPRVRTPIDAFVLAELEKKKLGLSPDADRVTLLRRAYFDLVGLPPTPFEIDAFVNDASPDAYDKVIDRLLRSPRYGERWARRWLDVAGYADSEGVLAADVIRPNAWRYRDYVIRAFNSDKPYNTFIEEQLAGDELVDYRAQDKLTPQTVEKLEATGFLRTAVDATRSDFLPDAFAEYQWRTFFDTEQIVASSLMGITLQCARCHDHKYEPFSQKDYYRLQAFFAGGLRPNGPVLPTDKRQIVEATAAEKKAAEENNAPVEPVVKALKALQAARLAEYRAKNPKKDEATEADLRKSFPDYAAKADALKQELREEEKKLIELPTIRAFYDIDQSVPPTKVLHRGDFRNPEQEVDPGIPLVLDDPAHPFAAPKPPADAKTSGRRRALADWLTRPDNPLAARVMVNRIWAEHFGTGLVPTVENFGRSGVQPVNQPLLDWLATEFVRQGWSVKALHRLIMTSTVYRQSSHASAIALETDPEDKLLWRMPPRRLEAEAVHDAVRQVAGTLDLKMYGAAVATKTKPSGEVEPAEEPASGRRAIYQVVRRSQPQSFLNAFDAPVMETNCTRRVVSTTATQALALMNGGFITEQAEHFARRVLKDAPPSVLADGKSIEYAFRLALGRRPTTSELHTLETFAESQGAHYSALGAEEAMLKVYADLCQALLSSNEFIYID